MCGVRPQAANCLINGDGVMSIRAELSGVSLTAADAAIIRAG